MPRIRLPRNPDLPVHVSARSTNKDWFAIPLPEVWEIMERYLYFIAHAYGVRIHAFVLMSNHFHLLISAPNGNLSECMRYFMTETSRALLARCRRINQIYGSRFHPTVIESTLHFQHAYKYVYRNPVKADLCRKAEEYPFSTLRGLLGQAQLTIPMIEDPLLFEEKTEKTLEWLNTSPSDEAWEQIRSALRKGRFELSKINNRPSPLETDAL